MRPASLLLLATIAAFPVFLGIGLGALAGQASVENLAYLLAVFLAVVAAVGVAALAWAAYALWLFVSARRGR